ncbi:MAG: DNA-binding protein [Cyanobacteria bacterium P01_G01_bin.67]
MVFKQRKVVGIMGSGQEPWQEFSIPLAQWIARQNYHLLTGGGSGVMAAAAAAFCQVEGRSGICIGIIPTELNEQEHYIPLNGYPNPWVELSITTPLTRFNRHNPNQIVRNHICILTSDVIIALPGADGTKNEVNLALNFGKPIILFGSENAMNNFPETIVKTTSLELVKSFVLNHG